MYVVQNFSTFSFNQIHWICSNYSLHWCSFLLTTMGISQNFTIVIHGGAGNIDPNMPEDIQQQYLVTLDSALNLGALYT
jgi:hypothetical protein